MALGALGETRALQGILSGTLYVSLHTGDPGSTGLNEVSGGAYVRKTSTFTLSGSNPTVAANDVVVQYDQATASWGDVSHFGVWDAASGGNFLGGGPTGTTELIAPNDIVRWEIGSLEVKAD